MKKIQGRHAEFIAPLPCIVCGKELEPSDAEGDNQPHGGTVFETHGHYGSTVFDPMWTPKYLEVTFCDECLVERGGQGRVLLFQRIEKRPKETIYKGEWKGPEDE
jgi:hypothetical protein